MSEPINSGLPIEDRILASYRDSLIKFRLVEGVNGLMHNRLAWLRHRLGSCEAVINQAWTAPKHEIELARAERRRFLEETEVFFAHWLAMTPERAQAQALVEGTGWR